MQALELLRLVKRQVSGRATLNSEEIKLVVTIAIEPCLVKPPTIICFTQQLTVQRHMTYLYQTVLIPIQKGADNTKIYKLLLVAIQ